MNKLNNTILPNANGRKSASGITLIALIITIIVLLILAGITISALTGSDSAPAKANEAKQKNDIGTAKDEIALTVQNAQTEAYDDIYVKNNESVKSTAATTAVGQRVINAVLQHFGGTARTGSNTDKLTATDTKGLVSVSITQANGTADAEITLTTRDYKQEGTIAYDGGTLTWEELAENTGAENVGTLADITSADYGNYLDLGTNILGNGTSGDWRILYNDTTNGKVYVKLADYLPNNYKENSSDTKSIIENLRLDTSDSFYVYVDYSGNYSEDYSSNYEANREIFLAKLNGTYSTNYWKGLLTGTTKSKISSGISNNKINVRGAVTAEILMASYNEKHGLTGDDALVYTEYPDIYKNAVDDSEGYDDLYLQDYRTNYYGYWLASPNTDNTNSVWCVYYQRLP